MARSWCDQWQQWYHFHIIVNYNQGLIFDNLPCRLRWSWMHHRVAATLVTSSLASSVTSSPRDYTAHKTTHLFELCSSGLSRCANWLVRTGAEAIQKCCPSYFFDKLHSESLMQLRVTKYMFNFVQSNIRQSKYIPTWTYVTLNFDMAANQRCSLGLDVWFSNVSVSDIFGRSQSRLGQKAKRLGLGA
jgi:hypothetical protein